MVPSRTRSFYQRTRIAMDSSEKQQAEGAWEQYRSVQEIWGDLTGDDMDRFEGKRKQLEGHVQEKTGESREAVQEKIESVSRETEYTF